jgi:excisionase family DNA binding protein
VPTVKPKTETSPRLLLTADDVAREIGVTTRTIRRLIACGGIKSIKIGRSRRIARSELERLALEGTVK